MAGVRVEVAVMWLQLQAIEFSNVHDSMQQMPILQTALLACMRMEALIPVLDLSNLPRLKHLSLQDVYPEQLSIPQGCRLDLQGEAQVMQQVCLLANQRVVIKLSHF